MKIFVFLQKKINKIKFIVYQKLLPYPQFLSLATQHSVTCLAHLNIT